MDNLFQRSRIINAAATAAAAEAAMAAATTSEQEFFARLQEAVAQLQDDQTAALKDASEMRQLVQALLQNEEIRLTAEVGPDDSRVAVIREASVYNQVVTKELNTAVQIAGISTTQVQSGGALIHGRVLDENGQAVSGLKVQVEDVNGKPIASLGSATTDTAGYYSLPVTPDALEKFNEAGAGATVTIRSSTGDIISRAAQPLLISANMKTFTPLSVMRAGTSAPVAETTSKKHPANKRPTSARKTSGKKVDNADQDG